MRQIRLCIGIASIVLIPLHAGAVTPAAGETKRGAFEITFTERSPLTNRKDLAARLGEKTPGEDYKLDEAPFGVFVPEDYDPARPHGILVYVGYKDAPACPENWKPLFQKTHTIYLSYTKHHENAAIQIGRVIDGVFNMKKLYNIDEQRIYSMGWHGEGVLMGAHCGDIFLKPIYIEPSGWRAVQMPNNRITRAEVPKPSGAPFGMAKSHRHVVISRSDQKELTTAVQKGLSQEGLTSTLIVVEAEEVHFSNVTAEWLEKSFEYLDAAPVTLPKPVAAKQAPTTAPATKAAGAPSDAARQLSAAKSYIAAKRYDLARTKLKAIVDQYPNDPAAKEAKTLLEQIKNEK